MRVLPFDAAPRRVAGISREVIDQVLEKHGLLGAAWNLPASLIRSPGPKGRIRHRHHRAGGRQKGASVPGRPNHFHAVRERIEFRPQLDLDGLEVLD